MLEAAVGEGLRRRCQQQSLQAVHLPRSKLPMGLLQQSSQQRGHLWQAGRQQQLLQRRPLPP